MCSIRRWGVICMVTLFGACGDDGAQVPPDAPVIPDAPAATLTVAAAPSSVTLARGDTADVMVTITRTNTLGPVFVGLSSLPSGVSASPILLVDGVDTGRITLTAGPSAAVASTDVQLVATAGVTTATTPLSVRVSNANGLLDRTFASSGYTTMTFGGTDASLLDVAIQPDGKLVVAGSVGTSPTRNAVIARVHPDGTLDSSFGTGGTVLWDLGADDTALGVALLGNGRVVVTAVSINGTTLSSAARLLSADGFAVSSDPSFGSQGTIASGANAGASRPVAHAAGASWAFDKTYYRYAPADTAPLTTGSNTVAAVAFAATDATNLLSLGPATTADLYVGLSLAPGTAGYAPLSSFGTNGVTNIGTTSGDIATSILARPNGNVLVAARNDPATNFTLAAVRASNGSFATNVGTSGRVSIDFAQGPDHAQALLGTTSGAIIAGAATPQGGTTTDLALARIYDSGDLDNDFGLAGLVTTDIAGGNDAIFDLARDGSGRLIVVGFATVQGHTVGLIARYSAAP